MPGSSAGLPRCTPYGGRAFEAETPTSRCVGHGRVGRVGESTARLFRVQAILRLCQQPLERAEVVHRNECSEFLAPPLEDDPLVAVGHAVERLGEGGPGVGDGKAGHGSLRTKRTYYTYCTF